MINVLKVVFLIIGTIIGAGLASGKEIYLFFGKYGFLGIIGIITSTLIIGCVIFKVLKITLKEDICAYENFLNIIIKKDNNNIKIIISNIINIFLLITFYIMVAAFSAYFVQEFKIPSIIGSICVCVMCYIIFKGNMNNIINTSSVLIPILIFFILLLVLKNKECLSSLYALNHMKNANNIILSSILYSSYNSILLIPILVTLKEYIKNKKQIWIISIFTVVIISVISLLILILISQIHNIELIEIPIMYIANRSGNVYSILGGISMIIAIFTSALSSGYAFLANFIKKPKLYNYINIAMCLSALLISRAGFSKLVDLLYPIFGFLGIMQIIMIIKKKT